MPGVPALRACPNGMEIVNRNENKQDADWCLVQTCSPSLKKNTRSAPYCRNQKVQRWKSKSKSKTQTATIQGVLPVSAATSEDHIRTAVHSTQPTACTSTQPHTSPVNSQQANHNNNPDVLGSSFPDVRAKAKRIGGLEVRSQYNLKFDPGASTLDVPPPPWEAQRPPGVEMSSCTPAALVDLCCRALDCRHVYIVLNGP